MADVGIGELEDVYRVGRGSLVIGGFPQVRLTPERRVPARAGVLFDAGIESLVEGLRSRLDR